MTIKVYKIAVLDAIEHDSYSLVESVKVVDKNGSSWRISYNKTKDE